MNPRTTLPLGRPMVSDPQDDALLDWWYAAPPTPDYSWADADVPWTAEPEPNPDSLYQRMVGIDYSIALRREAARQRHAWQNRVMLLIGQAGFVAVIVLAGWAVIR